MSQRILLWIIFTVSWLSALLLKKEKIKRYMPIAIFASFLVTIVYVIAYHRRWWKIENPTIPWLKSTELSFILGPFFVGTIWIFSLTYRFGFWVYILSNTILDSFFSFVFLPFLEKTGTITLKNITRKGILSLMLAIALVIYPFQKWQDGKRKRYV